MMGVMTPSYIIFQSKEEEESKGFPFPEANPEFALLRHALTPARHSLGFSHNLIFFFSLFTENENEMQCPKGG